MPQLERGGQKRLHSPISGLPLATVTTGGHRRRWAGGLRSRSGRSNHGRTDQRRNDWAQPALIAPLEPACRQPGEPGRRFPDGRSASGKRFLRFPTNGTRQLLPWCTNQGGAGRRKMRPYPVCSRANAVLRGREFHAQAGWASTVLWTQAESGKIHTDLR